MRAKKLGVVLFVLLAVAGCETPVPAEKLPEITFRHLPTYDLRVADIQIVVDAGARDSTGTTAGTFPVTPENALVRWAEDRLRAAGGSPATARFSIHVAKATRTKLPVKEGLTALFRKQVDERYDTAVDASLEIIDQNGTQRAVARANASRFLTMRDDETVAGRRQKLFDMVEEMMGEFNQRMDENIGRYVASWVR